MLIYWNFNTQMSLYSFSCIDSIKDHYLQYFELSTVKILCISVIAVLLNTCTNLILIFVFQTLSWRDLQYHVSAINNVHYFEDFMNNTVIPSRLGSDLVVMIPSNSTSQSQVNLIDCKPTRQIVCLKMFKWSNNHVNSQIIECDIGVFYTFLQDSQPKKLVNEEVILAWNIPAINGLIHVIGSPFRALPVHVSGRFCNYALECNGRQLCMHTFH